MVKFNENVPIHIYMTAKKVVPRTVWERMTTEEKKEVVQALLEEQKEAENIPEMQDEKESILYDINELSEEMITEPDTFFSVATVPIEKIILDRDIIERSVEYVNEIKEVGEKLKNNEINIISFYKYRSKILSKLYMKLYYKLHKKRYNATAKSKRVRKQNKKYKMTHGARSVVDKHRSCIFKRRFKEPTKIITTGGIMYYPSINQIQEISGEIIEAIKLKHNNIPNMDYTAMVSLQITGAHDTHTIASSAKVRINDFKGNPIDHKTIHENMEKSIQQIIVTIDGYSYVDEVAVESAYITVTAFAWSDINNWYPDIDHEYIPDICKVGKGTKVYAAISRKGTESEDKNCAQLCVEYLGGKWDTTKTIEEMIPQKKIIEYFPKTGNIMDVETIDDLVVNDSIREYENEDQIDKYIAEFTDTNDCKNIARILKANGHMGVIVSLGPSTNKNLNKVQKYRAVSKEKRSAVPTFEIFFDIEAYQEDNIDPSVSVFYQIPYLLCWTEANIEEVHAISSETCCKDFVDTLLNNYSSCKLVLYAWFGSGYDYHHILKFLVKRASSAKYILKNNSIMSIRMIFNKQNLIIVTKDPYLFMLTSLHKAAKAFNVTNKTEFPHTAIKSRTDLDKILDKWYSIKTSVIEKYPEFSNTNMCISRKQTPIYEEQVNTDTILEKAIEYCKIDVIAMKEIWLKFKTLLEKTLTVNITDETFTLSQLSMRLLEANLPKKVRLHVPSTETYAFLKQAIYGGRVIAKNGIYKEDILYADVVSLYPSAMQLLEHAYGPPRIVTKIDWKKHGIYKVELTHKDNKEPENYNQFVPMRTESGKLVWKWFKEHTGIYHTYDLLIAKESGYEVKCINGYEYPKKGNILTEFVEKLFDLKNIHSSCTCAEQPCPIRMIAKIALNGGGYGKFVQRPVTKDVHIVERDIVASLYDSCPRNDEGKIKVGNKYIDPPEFFNLDGDEYDKMVIEQEDPPRYATHCGISILSGSRYRLFKLCKQFPNIKIIYSDTDSIFALKSSVDENEFSKACGTQLGALDNTIEGSANNTISKMIVLGPKMYAYKYITESNEEKITFHAKGVPTSMLTWEQYEFLAQNKDNTVSYAFDTISKKLTAIMTRNIDKKIKQT